MVAKHKTGMFDVMSGRICEVAADLQLLAIINRIRNDVIKCVSFEQPSHKAASIVRNVVLLSQSGAHFEPASGINIKKRFYYA